MLSRLVHATIALSLAVCVVPAAIATESEQVPSEILNAWQENWNKKTNELIDEVVNGYRSDLAHADRNAREALLLEMKELLAGELSWETLGRSRVEKSLLSRCGAEHLEAVVPVYAGKKTFEDLPEDTQKIIGSCYSDVRLRVTSIPAYRMMAVAKESFPLLFARHQVNPQN